MKISANGLLSLLSLSTATQSSESEPGKTERPTLSPLKQKLTALVWHMANELQGETGGFISQWALRQMIESKLLPTLYQQSDADIRKMMSKAREFMSELENE